MAGEIKNYLKTEAAISAAFNFFINGMFAGLIHHKAGSVAVDPVSVAIDLCATCLSVCILTALFSRASLRRTKTEGVLETNRRIIRFLGRLFRCPALFGMLLGFAAAVVCIVLTVSVFTFLGIQALPFYLYAALKCVFAALFGGGVTALELYAGMCGK